MWSAARWAAGTFGSRSTGRLRRTSKIRSISCQSAHQGCWSGWTVCPRPLGSSSARIGCGADPTRSRCPQRGCSPKTIQRRVHSESFQLEYEDARKQGLETALAKVQIGMVDGANYLLDVVNSTTQLPPARMNAAKSLLQYGCLMTNLLDVTMRQVEVEEDDEEAS